MMRHKIPFGRTPKIQGKTLAPPFYVKAECAILIYCFAVLVTDLLFHHWFHFLFALITAVSYGYAAVYFMGWAEIRYAFSPQKKTKPSMLPSFRKAVRKRIASPFNQN
jgi:cellulose synthase (UDP-forming)